MSVSYFAWDIVNSFLEDFPAKEAFGAFFGAACAFLFAIIKSRKSDAIRKIEQINFAINTAKSNVNGALAVRRDMLFPNFKLFEDYKLAYQTGSGFEPKGLINRYPDPEIQKLKIEKIDFVSLEYSALIMLLHESNKRIPQVFLFMKERERILLAAGEVKAADDKEMVQKFYPHMRRLNNIDNCLLNVTGQIIGYSSQIIDELIDYAAKYLPHRLIKSFPHPLQVYEEYEQYMPERGCVPSFSVIRHSRKQIRSFLKERKKEALEIERQRIKIL